MIDEKTLKNHYEYNQRMKVLEKHLGKAFYKTGELHNKIDDAILEMLNSNRLEKLVSPIFTEEEHRILNLLLASKIAEIQVNIVYDEPLDQRMGKVKLMNILNDIHKKVKIRS